MKTTATVASLAGARSRSGYKSPARVAHHAARLARRLGVAASDDGPILSTVAKLVDALNRSIPEGMQNAELKNEALRRGRELLRGTKYEET